MPREFKTILVPTDFSEPSKRAVEYALRFARLSEGTILLAHVIHIATEHLRDDQGHLLTFDQIKQQATAQLAAIRDSALEGYARTELIADLGDPYAVLMEIATRRQVDLVVTSTRGRSIAENLIIGSVAEKLIRHAPCPVFIVRRGAA